jgi:hypothetical protein
MSWNRPGTSQSFFYILSPVYSITRLPLFKIPFGIPLFVYRYLERRAAAGILRRYSKEFGGISRLLQGLDDFFDRPSTRILLQW